MNKDITEFPNLKQIEQILWSKLQEIFSKALKSLLEDMDQQIVEERDKKRFRLLDRRKLQIVSLFDEIEVKRNYCRDRKTGEEYVYLLDRYLDFEGTGTFSPLMEEAAIELATQGPSDRKAARTLETLLGYRVISHETIRKYLLEASNSKTGVRAPACSLCGSGWPICQTSKLPQLGGKRGRRHVHRMVAFLDQLA
ncbi:UPF0236 family protein [Caldibacillus debilis]|jgi:hypothetical protein|uniref:Uncharacterized protein family (UPF0236) n=1 Tax=Caldibacillus debilis GB1 TaxID=1339248 RepID=A0A420VIW3_9BACI|nr:UPF0236 family protein [Caldibacillus debilis]RKO63456.1 Uncharacterized protein family (UPF0236) [Caldibacillus debilis GB1]